jgi:MFS family permease
MENVLTPTTDQVSAQLGARSPSAVQAPRRAGLWIGRVLTGLCAAFLLVDALGKLLMLAPYVEGTRQVGYAIGVLRPLGVVLALSTLLHLLPRTQLVGALLLTAYLGGATATHVRMSQPFWFPVAMGVILWCAYALRSPSLRALILSSPQTRPETN